MYFGTEKRTITIVRLHSEMKLNSVEQRRQIQVLKLLHARSKKPTNACMCTKRECKS